MTGRGRLRRATARISFAGCALASLVVASSAQGPPAGAPPVTMGTPGDWPTTGADAQRDGWLRADPYLSIDSVRAPEFALQWSVKLGAAGDGQIRFTGGAAMGGRKPITFVSDTAGYVRAIDNDTGFDYWERRLGASRAVTTPAGCSAGVTSGVVRSTALIAPVTGAAKGGGFGAAVRPAYSGFVSAPGDGIADLLLPPRAGGGGRVAAPATAAAGNDANAGRGGAAAPVAGAARVGGAAAPPAATAGAATALPAPRGGAGGGGGRGGAGAPGLYAIAPDGVLHILGENSGLDIRQPVPFLPAGANATGLSLVGNIAYAFTTARCGSAPNALWAVDLASESKAVKSWETGLGEPLGVPAFGQDGTIYVAVGAARTGGPPSGSSTYANAIVALDPRTLVVKDWFTQQGQAVASTPMVMRINNRDVVAAASADGRVLLLDSASLGGADHRQPAFVSPAYGRVTSVVASLRLASWQDTSGARWVLLSLVGSPTTALVSVARNGAVTGGTVMAAKISDARGKLAMQPAWISRDLTSPWAPIVANGVLFALSGGPAAVLYALDPATGKPIWDSGRSMTGAAGDGALVVGNSQVHVTTTGGTVYAFGVAMERH